jgi:hypothetical protein
MSNGHDEIENIEEFPWMGALDFERQSAFLVKRYQRLEIDFLDYLNYVPLRNEHLEVSSWLLADYVLRITPHLATAFRLLTFGNPMFFQSKVNKRILEDDVFRKKFLKKMESLNSKREKNEDHLHHYHKFLNQKQYGSILWFNRRISDLEIETNFITGQCEYDEGLKPFKAETWFSWYDYRDSIEHRGQTEASVYHVLQGLACLAILLTSINMYDPIVFNSKLFTYYI